MLYTEATVILVLPSFSIFCATMSADACPNSCIALCTASLCGVALSEYLFNTDVKLFCVFTSVVVIGMQFFLTTLSTLATRAHKICFAHCANLSTITSRKVIKKMFFRQVFFRNLQKITCIIFFIRIPQSIFFMFLKFFCSVILRCIFDSERKFANFADLKKII